MEDPKIYKIEELSAIDLTFTDIRQSQQWEEYLSTLGWKSTRTDSGILIETIKTGFMKIAKIQRPKPLSLKELKEFDNVASSEGLAFVKIEPTLKQDLNTLVANEYLVSQFPLVPPATIFVDLTISESELWEKLSTSAKYSINRARRENTRIEIIRNPDDFALKKFHDLAQFTGSKKRFFVQEFSELKTKANLFGDNCLLIFAYDKSGNLSCGKFFLGYGNTIWYMHGGTTDIGQRNKSGYLLTWDSIVHFKSLGFSILDFEGVADPRFPFYTHNWEGLTHFKRKFNGYEVRFPAPHIKIYSKLMKKLNSFYRLPL